MNEWTGNPVLCDSLEACLAGELPAERRSEFEDHLLKCPACRSAVDDWRALCRILETATSRLENPSPELWERVQRPATVQMRQHDRGLQKGRVAALIGASVAAGILFMVLLRPPPPREESVKVSNVQPPAIAASKPPKLEFPDDVIGVPIDIGKPNVTVVWLYPTVKSANQTN
ncbi:MAG TPA: zf-HC2 domain-containing protein [Planctomycetaceae bacterium]|nr:zf-HC2 domain-containing protein [Planctomycetaceae bacterium]